MASGCATPRIKKTSAMSDSQRVVLLEKKLKAKESLAQDQRDRKMVLGHAGVEEVPVIEDRWKKLTEKEAYAELLAAEQKQDLPSARGLVELFRRKFATSIFADDALYVLGVMELKQNNFGPAVRVFNEVLTRYPLSQRASASLFAKGVAFKKMNLPQFAKPNFELVKKKFAGSPEAFKAGAELKLIK